MKNLNSHHHTQSNSSSQLLINQEAIAKVFQSGNSQAVRLPKAYQFDTNEVTIQKVGDSMLLTPKKNDDCWANRLEKFFDSPDLSVPFQRSEQLPAQKREDLVF